MRDGGQGAEAVSDNATPRKAKPRKKAKPGRKRMGKEVFVPVTMKVEPSELATIEMIAKASKRSRSDVMREMVTLGMQQMLECAFAPKGEAFSVDAEAAVRDAVMAITDAAVGSKTSETRTNEGVDGVPEPEAPGDPKLARALAQKGAREIVDYVSRHPRANTSELLAATGFSSSTLRRRIVALQKADAIFNDGTATRPVWRVPGVEHGPEEMLTATQAAVLGLMRREPPTPTGQISSELGLTKTAVTLAYRELADLGLAFKDGGRWRATSQKDAEGVADA